MIEMSFSLYVNNYSVTIHELGTRYVALRCICSFDEIKITIFYCRLNISVCSSSLDFLHSVILSPNSNTLIPKFHILSSSKLPT